MSRVTYRLFSWRGGGRGEGGGEGEGGREGNVDACKGLVCISAPTRVQLDLNEILGTLKNKNRQL